MTCPSPDSLQKFCDLHKCLLTACRAAASSPRTSCSDVRRTGISIRRRTPRSESPVDESLHAERASTSAGRFYLRIVELEARAFERVHEVHFNAIQVQKAGLVDKDFEPVRVVRLVQHARVVIETHRVAEAGATSADD